MPSLVSFIIIISNPLDSSKGLPAVSLLNYYMDIILSVRRKQIITLTYICQQGVEKEEVLESRHDSFSSVKRPVGGSEAGEGRAEIYQALGSEEPRGGRLLSPRWWLSDWGCFQAFVRKMFMINVEQNWIQSTIIIA